MTGIARLQKTGIIRIGTPARGFKYKPVNGKKLSTADLTRIQKLRVPPAWTDVAINPSPNGKLQVVGRDAAGRWQYLYHESHTKAQENRKYRRLIHFMEDLPRMRSIDARHLRQPGIGRERV